MKNVGMKEWLVVVVMVLSMGLSLRADVSFEPVLSYTAPVLVGPPDTPGGIFSLAIGDLKPHGDGMKDIYFGLKYPSPLFPTTGVGRLSWAVQEGGPRGMFTSVFFQSSGFPARTYVADMNGDDIDDVLYSRDIYYDDSSLYLGSFARYLSLGGDPCDTDNWNYGFIGNMGGWFTGPAIKDLNQDGKVDLVRVRNKDGQVSRYFNDGSGNFTGYYNFMTFNDAMARPGEDEERYPIVAGHLDATNPSTINDIAIARPVDGQLFIVFQQPVGVFNVDPDYTIRPFACGGYGEHGENDFHLRPTHLGIGDFNLDGKNDVLVVREDGAVYSCYQMGPQDFSYTALLMNYGMGVTDMKVGDVDNDGSDDYVIARSDGNLYVNLQKTPGVFTNQLIATHQDPNTTCIDIGDMDGDSLTDIVVGLDNGDAIIHYQNQPSCTQNISGDLTDDCMVDSRDLAALATQWLKKTAGPPYWPADLSGDNEVNLEDFAIFSFNWLKCNLVNQDDCWK